MQDSGMPQWFKERMVMLFSLYPNTQPTAATIAGWWEHLSKFEPRALRLAFERAPSASPTFCPTAPMVGEWASAIEKTPQARAADLNTPALAEPEPDISNLDPEIRDLLEQLKSRLAMTVKT